MTDAPKPFLLHATCVAIDGYGVALCGRSGSGKSDLALRLIDRGAKLVGDDYLDVVERGAVPVVCYQPSIAGQMEVRGLGIITLPYVKSAPLRLLAILDEPVERLPEPGLSRQLAGFDIPALRLDAFAVSAAIKVELALRALVDAGRIPVGLTDMTAIGQSI
jgi:serine kinase of HPr protein (carbohydrate metabolism regulator)